MNHTRALRLMVVLICSLPGNAPFAADWHSIADGNELSFTVAFEGADATGRFRDFAVHMKIDPEGHGGDSMFVKVDILSATMDNDEIDAGMASTEWFDSKQFPQSTFRSSKVHRTGQDFVADGVLQIKGISQNVSVPFHWEQQHDQAWINGELALSRMDFNIGLGEWQDESVIADSVRVRFRVLLEPQR